jgi:6-pyruvoyltetrahydropterin/6-carboxytetrahydropterin synthase
MNRSKTLYLTRQVEFCAAHRLHRPDLSEEENLSLFGKCANPHGHGHNYLLEATFKGEVDPHTGTVVHFSSLKRLLDEVVISPLDHRNLNFDVPMMQGIIPSSENLIIRIWEEIERTIRGQPWSLFRLRLRSSTNNWVEYGGN